MAICCTAAYSPLLAWSTTELLHTLSHQFCTAKNMRSAEADATIAPGSRKRGPQARP